ncbi:glycoside hydrolase family 5 protein [Mycena floridula]|nr:glycoside hydrolase family 5 protein [Mycena floridula]
MAFLFLPFAFLALAKFGTVVDAGLSLPNKIYGVNLGSWLVLEPWMLPQEWLNMGGESCDDCSTCIDSEFAMAKAYPKTVDQKFDAHWSSWFSKTDVQQLKSLGINTVRIPLGYWIIEQLVDRKTEFFPRGGLAHLKRGLQDLSDAGIVAILDHHALPGVQSPQQQFTGRCTEDPQFYTSYNYHRALVWTATMTALAHQDPTFNAVAAIEAVNEPIMDASLTPGYGEFQRLFVLTVRAVELALGLPFRTVTRQSLGLGSLNFTASLSRIADSSQFEDVSTVLTDAIPILVQLGIKQDVSSGIKALTTNFMDVNWQSNNPANPADVAVGPQAYDNHLYYSFGGVADANEDAYMESICNLQRVQADAAVGDSPLWFGEWGLPTQFAASDAFLNKWADAQKLAYSKGAGWIFWNFKIEKSSLAGDLARQWSYVEGVNRGYLTKDPSKLHNTHVCDAYVD